MSELYYGLFDICVIYSIFPIQCWVVPYIHLFVHTQEVDIVMRGVQAAAVARSGHASAAPSARASTRGDPACSGASAEGHPLQGDVLEREAFGDAGSESERGDADGDESASGPQDAGDIDQVKECSGMQPSLREDAQVRCPFNCSFLKCCFPLFSCHVSIRQSHSGQHMPVLNRISHLPCSATELCGFTKLAGWGIEDRVLAITPSARELHACFQWHVLAYRDTICVPCISTWFMNQY